MAKKTIAIRGFTYKDDDGRYQFATRGQEVDLSSDWIKNGEKIGAFVGSEPASEAPDAFDIRKANDEELVAYIEESDLNVRDTVALAEGDAELAERVLAAEENASEGEPRVGVVNGLEKLLSEE